MPSIDGPVARCAFALGALLTFVKGSGASMTTSGHGRQLTALGETVSTCPAASYCGALNDTCCVPNTLVNSSATTVLSLEYNATTGVFNGSVVTNQCPAHRADYVFNGTLSPWSLSPICVRQSFPAAAYVPPAALPAGSRIGIALRSGESIFG
jgi:hypothetical protein